MSSQPPDRRRIAILGGTGPEGRGLAMRLARAGHSVIIGSRDADRAASTARELGIQVRGADLTGTENQRAAQNADVIILAVPYSGLGATADAVRDCVRQKIVISAVAPVEFVDGRPAGVRVEEGSAAQQVQHLLPDARVVSAFQNVDAHALADLDQDLVGDVVVCSDHQDERRAVMALVSDMGGLRPLSGGKLSASRYVEEITVLLITLNRIYKTHASVRFTGIDR